jgi:predicted SnoaL-like aldol condensation-catalyzing enzyme
VAHNGGKHLHLAQVVHLLSQLKRVVCLGPLIGLDCCFYDPGQTFCSALVFLAWRFFMSFLPITGLASTSRAVGARRRASAALLALSLLGLSVPATAQTASPKELVTAFYDQAFVKGQAREAILKYISPTTYIQHNPNLPDGRDAVLTGLPAWLSKSGMRAEIKRVIAEGDLVVVHSRFAVPGKAEVPAMAVMDIFRVQGGLIVQHWDVIQEVPKTAANNNTMF